MVDIDGVVSLFGFAGHAPWTGHPPPDGLLPHDRRHTPLPLARRRRPPAGSQRRLRPGVGQRLGGEGRGVPAAPARPALAACRSCASSARLVATNAHWKLTAIETYAGSRALAWIDDAFNDACHAWARGAPGAHAARPDRPRARPHLVRGKNTGRVGTRACGRGLCRAPARRRPARSVRGSARALSKSAFNPTLIPPVRDSGPT